jgi:type I restriction enzyme, R subunit
VALYDRIAALRPDWVTDDDATGKVKVVMTGSAADEAWAQPHVRSKTAMRELKARAQNPEDELELVIVRDMWLTGFDSPSMHTMYVDKPMRGAPLMQAIARVNRTFRDKPAGLVVDYIGIAEDLRSALANYTDRDRAGEEMGQDLRAEAIPEMLTEHDIVCGILAGFDWRSRLAAGGDRAYLAAVAATINYLLGSHPGPVEDPCTAEQPCVKCRFNAHAGRLRRLFAVCAPGEEALTIRDDVAFFEAVRSAMAKIDGVDRRTDSSADLDTAIRQLVSDAMAGDGVIDIYAEAGLAKPDISLIDDDFVAQFSSASNQNLQIEMVRRLINDEINITSRRNVVAGRAFSEMLNDAIRKYQNRTIDAAQVMLELAAIAADMQAAARRGEELGMTDAELAFYDAICTNDAAVIELGDDKPKSIAHDLVDIVRRDAKTDWAVKEQVRAKLRASVRRLLLKHGYPPDQQEEATLLVLRQAEVLAGEAA